VADQKPPRLKGDERETLLALLQYQRESFVRKVGGADEALAAMSPVASGTSLLWLTNHMADAEAIWVLHRFAGRPGDGPGTAARDIRAAIARYRGVWGDVDAVIDGAGSLDRECPAFDDQPVVNLRWILAHLLQETARHAGHADILRELIDGQTGR
jgi:hypothetical protein